MKKYLIALAMVSLVLPARAQFGDHKLLVGGNVSGSYTKQSISSSSQFGLQPKVGMVVGSNNVVGLYFGSSFNFYSGPDDISSRNRSAELGLFAQKYFPLKENLFFNLELNAGFNNFKSTFYDGSNDYENNIDGYQARLAPGLTWRASERVLLTGSVAHITFTNYTTKILTIGLGAPSLGVNFLLK